MNAGMDGGGSELHDILPSSAKMTEFHEERIHAHPTFCYF
jgi:hypothetical protein